MKKVHWKDPKYNFPLYHFSTGDRGERLTLDPKKVTCKICLREMLKKGGK